MYDFIVVGAGIAGSSVAAELAQSGSVLVLEAETVPGYHSTGRSAAVFAQNYGSEAFRILTRASRTFFENPPEGFSDNKLLGDRAGTLFVARHEQAHDLDRLEASIRSVGGRYERLSGSSIIELCPAIRADVVPHALYDPEDRDIDVASLHQGYLKKLRQRGGELITGAAVTSVMRKRGYWEVYAKTVRYEGRKLINAAGAWGDVIAAMAGLKPIGLSPRRRTAITFAGPSTADASRWPMCMGVSEDFYFKPDAGMILASPANEDEMYPCDVQADELDVAICVDRIEMYTTLEVRRIASRWAGLRTFTVDRGPGIGPDPEDDDFIWCVGQGGYGIQSSPAVSRLCASFALGTPVPFDLSKLGLNAGSVSVARFLRPPDTF